MSYTPLQIKANPSFRRFSTMTPFKGENLRVFSSLLDPNGALKISNYIPDAEGKLRKRKGLQKIFEVAGTSPVTLLERFTDDVIIFGYGTTIASYTESTNTVATIKSNFSANSGFGGVRYGEYFFVCNGVEKIWRITNLMTISEIAASPVCTSLLVFGNRLVAVGVDSTAVQYSDVDDGTDPPFSSWNNSTTATQGGKVNYRNAGAANKAVSLGNVVVVFAEFGKWAFTIDQIDSAGTLKKIDNTVVDRRDLGGDAAIVTKKGIFYVNEGGLVNLVSLGQENVPFSDQEFLTSHILGPEYFENINFDGAALLYDDISEILYISCKKGGVSQNNYIFGYNTNTKAFFRLSGWTIGTFFVDTDGTIWAGSSVATKVYNLFEGYDDDGLQIGTEYYQELNVGDINTLKTLQKIMVQADLSASTELTISFDTFDNQGVFRTAVASYTMGADAVAVSGGGYGEVSYGSSWSSAGGSSDGTLPTYDTFKPFLKNFQRIRVKITSADNLPHTLNLFSAEIKEKSLVRKRNITLVT